MNSGLGIPFVPFTFSTVSFCRVAVKMGLWDYSWPYVSLWGWADTGWATYQRIRPQLLKDHGEDALGNSEEAVRLMEAAGMKYQDAADWLGVADAASDDFWASGTAMADFKGGGVPVVIRDTAEGVGVAIRSVAGSILKGVTGGGGKVLPLLVIGGLVYYGVSRANKRRA